MTEMQAFTGYQFASEIGMWRSKMIDIAVTLRNQSICRSVRTGLDIRMYESGLMIELFVDTELATGAAITYWIDIVPNEFGPWRVEASIRRMSGDEQLKMRSVEERDVQSVSELTSLVDQIIDVFRTTDPSVAL